MTVTGIGSGVVQIVGTFFMMTQRSPSSLSKKPRSTQEDSHELAQSTKHHVPLLLLRTSHHAFWSRLLAVVRHELHHHVLHPALFGLRELPLGSTQGTDEGGSQEGCTYLWMTRYTVMYRKVIHFASLCNTWYRHVLSVFSKETFSLTLYRHVLTEKPTSHKHL